MNAISEGEEDENFSGDTDDESQEEIKSKSFTHPARHRLVTPKERCSSEPALPTYMAWEPEKAEVKTTSKPRFYAHVLFDSQSIETRGPFLERLGNLTGPESDFDIKGSRKVGRVLTSDEVHFVSLADNFTVQFSNLLKLPLEWKTNSITGPVITGSFEKRAPRRLYIGGGETGSPFLVQCVMQRRTATSAPSHTRFLCNCWLPKISTFFRPDGDLTHIVGAFKSSEFRSYLYLFSLFGGLKSYPC